MGNFYTYKCELKLNFDDATNVINKLWHFTNLFPVFEFSVNDAHFGFLGEAPQSNSLLKTDENHFVLEFCYDNKNIGYFVDVLNTALEKYDFVPLCFLPD